MLENALITTRRSEMSHEIGYPPRGGQEEQQIRASLPGNLFAPLPALSSHSAARLQGGFYRLQPPLGNIPPCCTYGNKKSHLETAPSAQMPQRCETARLVNFAPASPWVDVGRIHDPSLKRKTSGRVHACGETRATLCTWNPAPIEHAQDWNLRIPQWDVTNILAWASIAWSYSLQIAAGAVSERSAGVDHCSIESAYRHHQRGAELEQTPACRGDKRCSDDPRPASQLKSAQPSSSGHSDTALHG
ncbi:hypothetical protein CERZMDRAFT_87245 [Cercospora zeae-maydis SCOH1-5]|uniref:Uncharacterized protein n=1 Tax=Cercospora zeae-maydis SCOH1-5 TaxID=717836 RepID=A0A6A6F8E6_9PEZI|nr:hypothetical protein CERZMDRAFT_87245 [Cercospora zeae-maydis SCOH1-5]